MKTYLLDGHTPVETPIEDWVTTFDWRDPARRVARDVVGHAIVSTVFLGIEDGGGLFETMVFRSNNKLVRRYDTWDEALAGHVTIVAALREGRTS